MAESRELTHQSDHGTGTASGWRAQQEMPSGRWTWSAFHLERGRNGFAVSEAEAVAMARAALDELYNDGRRRTVRGV